MKEQPADPPAVEIAQLVAEIRRDFPHKAAEIDTYVQGARFQRLDPAHRLEALHILRGALQDARRKVTS